jgi:hypothetical protein
LFTIAHEWTINNFIELDEEAQVTFKVAIEGNEELRLIPHYTNAFLTYPF